jgi:hypothetical protein
MIEIEYADRLPPDAPQHLLLGAAVSLLLPLKPGVPETSICRGDVLMVDAKALVENPELEERLSIAIQMGTLAPLHLPEPPDNASAPIRSN